LAPYFIEFMTRSVMENLRHLSTLVHLMKFAQALLDNPHLFIEPYLHHLMPNILTCTISKTLGKSPTVNHWDLRSNSAILLGKIIKRYGNKYPSLSPRLCKTLVRCILQDNKGFGGCFGAIRGLAEIGPHAVSTLLLPNLSLLNQNLDPILSDSDTAMDDQQSLKKTEAEKVFNCAVETCVPVVVSEAAKKHSLSVVDGKLNVSGSLRGKVLKDLEEYGGLFSREFQGRIFK
jgi:transcription initiation factor TFIID subunit 6